MIANAYRVSFGDNKNIPELDSGDLYTLKGASKITASMVCELGLHKKKENIRINISRIFSQKKRQ